MKTSTSDRWLFVGLCLLVLLAPLPLGSHRTWSAQLLQIAIGLLAFGTFLQMARGQLLPSPALRQSQPALWLMAGIPLWTLIQLIPWPFLPSPISQDIGASLYKLQKSVCYLLVFLLCLQLLNTPARLRQLAEIIVISGVFQASYGVLVVLGGESLDILGIQNLRGRTSDATGTYLNRNHLAGWLEMSLAVGIGLLIASVSGQERATSWRARLRRLLITLLGGKARLRLFLVVMVIGLVMTHSRMGNSAFFASMGLCAVIGLFIYRRHSRSMALLFASMIAIDVLIVSSWFGLERLAQRIENTHIETEERTDVNANALPWVQDNWLTGSGAGSFASQFPAYRSADIGAFFDFAHNDYLQLLGEYGVIGGLLFASIALLSLHTALQAQRHRQTPLLRGMGFASMMGIISLLIHSTVDFNLHLPANAMLFTMLCAFAFIARHQELAELGPRKRSRRPHAINNPQLPA